MMSQAISPIANRPIWVRKADWRGETKPPFGAPLNRDHWAAKNLVASYLFNEGAGRTVYDSSGNENHGTMIGFGAEDTATSGWVPGSHGGAIAFDGSDDGITLPAFSTPFPMSVFVGFSSSMTDQGMMFARRISASDWTFMLRLDPGGLPACYLSQSGNDSIFSSIISPFAYNDGKLHQLVVSYQPNIFIKMYVDGIIIKESTSSIISSIASKTYGYTIGKRNQTGTEQYFNGLISYISLYSRTLSPDEISYLAAFPYCMYGG